MGCFAVIALAVVGWFLLGPLGSLIALVAGLLLVVKSAK